MDKLRFLTESRNGKESVIEKLIHKDNFSSNRISCNIAEKSDIKSVMDICFSRQQWMTEQGLEYVLCKDNRKYYRYAIEDRKLWVCKQSGVVMGFCVVDDHDINGYWKDFPTDSFVYAHDGMTRPPKSVKETSEYNFMGILLNGIMEFFGKGLRFDVLLPNQKLESYYEKELGFNPVGKVVDEEDGSYHLLMEKTNNNISLSESFTKKIKSVRKSDLNSEPSFVLDNGVYILHETFGVKTVKGWNTKNNEGVIGVLLIEDEHQLVVALEDSPEKLQWSKFEYKLVNRPIEDRKDAESDFNGEKYCKNLNSPEFPAAYYCSNYEKGGRDWYLPSSGEPCMIYQHIEEVQSALSIVGGQVFVTDRDVADVEGFFYWSSTEYNAEHAWDLDVNNGYLSRWVNKVSCNNRVRPVSNFRKNTLKESFTKKISSKKNTDLVSKPSFVLDDGVYILHETLGVKTVDSWNNKDNEGVVGILVVEGEHKIVVATEDSPENLHWSKKRGLINQPVDDLEEAESDFNGEMYCQKLNSPDFPAAYYCKTYNKGGRSWNLPSSGELWLIYRHLEEIQTALSIVEGQKFVTTWDDDVPCYWSSTERSATNAWYLSLRSGNLCGGVNKVSFKTRPISKFQSFELKESFTKKISSKKNTDLVSKPSFVLDDGVYILHETLGVKTVDSWNTKDNDGVVGILLIEDDRQLVVALEDSPKNLLWSEERKLVNYPIQRDEKDAESDFNGEEYCKNLNSPVFPAAYYCLNYNKGGRSWYLPSEGELRMIYLHLEEIQNALSIVGGQKFVTTWDDDVPCYWSSTEGSDANAWDLYLNSGYLGCDYKLNGSRKVRPVSNFRKKNTLRESFTKKISSKKNTDLISKPSFVPDDGVYILHETLGVRGVEGWNPKDNDGVVGILVVEDEHQLVVALEDSPKNLIWSKERKLVNRPIKDSEDAESDFNGEEYCRNLNSPDFPAAYYCLNYKKGGLDWYLPSAGELWLIYQHIEEVQNALSIVGGQRFDTGCDKCNKTPCYWSSTEYSAIFYAWGLYLHFGGIDWDYKASDSLKVRPISKFQPSELKESFTRKIRSKKNDELTAKADTAFEIPDGVYILHETLGVKSVKGWNPKYNEGVVGILVIEDEHKIVVALEDATGRPHWSKKYESFNKPINSPVGYPEDYELEKSDFNGEEYCRNLNSPDFPAAYYCLNYKKGGRNWYLPSIGELWMIKNHLKKIQSALEAVGGKKFDTALDARKGHEYWSSTECDDEQSCKLSMYPKSLFTFYVGDKVHGRAQVRPVSKFGSSKTLKESFTKKIKKTSNKDLVDTADKLAITNYDYNEENFKNKLRSETERYYKSEFYKVHHCPLDYRYNGDIWSADENGFHEMWLTSTKWVERDEGVDFEGYFNDVDYNCAVPADVGIFVFGYGKDCVAYGEYEEYKKARHLTESFVSKTKKKTIKDLQGKSDDVFNLNNLLREYVKSHCRPGSHNFDFYFTEENRPAFSDKKWKKLKGITVVKEIDDYYPSLHVVTPNGFTISDDFLPNADDVFLFYVYKRRKFHIPVNRLPEKLLQELMEWILNINESFTRKTKQKSTEDIKQKADEHIGFENLVKEIVLENDSFKENDTLTKTFRNRQPRYTHALNKLRVRPTSDPTLSPYAIQGMVVLDKSFYFKPEKYNISSLLAKNLTRKSMKELYNSDSIIVLNRIYTMEYLEKELLRTEFNILRYNERYGRYSDEMNPQYVYFEFTDLPKELQSDIYSFLHKKFIKN